MPAIAWDGWRCRWRALLCDPQPGRALYSNGVQCKALILKTHLTHFNVYAELGASSHVTCLCLPQWWLLEKREYYYYQIDKVAHCSLYLAANVPPFLSKRDYCCRWNILWKVAASESKCSKLVYFVGYLTEKYTYNRINVEYQPDNWARADNRLTLPVSSSCQHRRSSWSHRSLRDPHFPWGGAGS